MWVRFQYERAPRRPSALPIADIFGVRGPRQLGRDLRHVLGNLGGGGFQLDLSSAKHLRPDLSWPAYLNMRPRAGEAPIMNLFDRVGGGKGYSQRVTKQTCRDFRGGILTYDEHDGVDFVLPVATPLVAAAPGRVTLIRDRWLRGGLTMTVDHGAGVSTQYTHLSRAVAEVGQTVRRGEVIAWSGASGLDMTLFFPWVPPHLHFMSWVDGLPVDPYLRPDEPERTGTWEARNDPAPGDPRDALFPAPEVDVPLLHELAALCADPFIQREIRAVSHDPLALAALLEDSIHHDGFAWPEDLRGAPFRRRRPGEHVALSLPLSWDRYQRAVFADLW